MASIELDHIRMDYGGPAAVVDDLSLRIHDGEFFVLIGPSGCGKSTLLRLLAGLEHPAAGTIRLDGTDVTGLDSRHRDIAMVFQNYAIYPHMTVRRNLGYGLRVRGADRRSVAERVDAVAGMLGLEHLLDRRPATLSGGQLQRVAMGRAIARQPRVYLMDEPLSNLDAKLRVTMRSELERLHRSLGVTTVYVTHDQVEAMTLGQRAAVLRGGRIQQVGTPDQLYRAPANAFVAAFIGSPPMNFAVAVVRDGMLLLGNGVSWRLPDSGGYMLADGQRVLVGIRPEDIRERGEPGAEVRVRCMSRQNLGADVLMFFELDTSPQDCAVIDRLTHSDRQPAETRMPDGRRQLCARLPGTHSVRPGAHIGLAVDPDAVHLFDIDTGDRLAQLGSAEPVVR